MKPQDIEAKLAAATTENVVLRWALEQVAQRTIQRDLNRLAHEVLGHTPNPQTVRLMAEVEREWALDRRSG